MSIFQCLLRCNRIYFKIKELKLWWPILKWGTSSRSSGPNTTWGNIETATLGKTHPTLRRWFWSKKCFKEFSITIWMCCAFLVHSFRFLIHDHVLNGSFCPLSDYSNIHSVWTFKLDQKPMANSTGDTEPVETLFVTKNLTVE